MTERRRSIRAVRGGEGAMVMECRCWVRGRGGVCGRRGSRCRW